MQDRLLPKINLLDSLAERLLHARGAVDGQLWIALGIP